jgi:hypothetical protein
MRADGELVFFGIEVNLFIRGGAVPDKASAWVVRTIDG